MLILHLFELIFFIRLYVSHFSLLCIGILNFLILVSMPSNLHWPHVVDFHFLLLLVSLSKYVVIPSFSWSSNHMCSPYQIVCTLTVIFPHVCSPSLPSLYVLNSITNDFVLRL